MPVLAAPLLAGKGDGAHKPFWPMDQQDVMTIALATLGLIVAAGGGIGGGGILVRHGQGRREGGREGGMTRKDAYEDCIRRLMS
mgnify:CR=1 FL=1